MTWQDLATHDLKMYSTAWCGDCRRFKSVLGKHDIAYVEIDIDADLAAANRLREKTGRTAIPFLEIDGGPMVRGWHTGAPGGLDEATFLAEVEAALAQ